MIKSIVPEHVESELKHAYLDEVRMADFELLQASICCMIAPSSRLYMIIDGIDECEKPAREYLIALLERLLALSNASVKIFVSSREDNQISRSFDKYPCVQLSETLLAKDIETFVIGSVRSKINTRRLRVSDPALEHEIVSELVTKAHGMLVPLISTPFSLSKLTLTRVIMNLYHYVCHWA